jgi:hypothetical protein
MPPEVFEPTISAGDWLGLTYFEKFLPPIGKPSALFIHYFYRHFDQSDLDMQWRQIDFLLTPLTEDLSQSSNLLLFVNKKVQLDATVCRHLFTAP